MYTFQHGQPGHGYAGLWLDFSAYSFRRGFPTEKSEALLKRVVEVYSDPGDVVLDCFAGSGTTGAAAALLERRWVLIEQGEQAVTHILPRLQELGPPGFRFCELESS